MRDSSLEAFKSILGQLSTKRGKVYRVFYQAERPLCDYEAAVRLGWPINCVTPRRGELVAMGYLAECGLRVGPPNNFEVHYFEVADATLREGFVPKVIAKKMRTRQRAAAAVSTMTVSMAARVLALARRGKKQKPAVRRKAMPLFGEF